MSPLGKPTPDGEIVQGTRHYAGRTLGEATIWKCPACGKQNEGRKPEQGCGLCGAGNPGKQKAGLIEQDVPPVGLRPEAPRRDLDSLTRSAGKPEGVRSVESIRVLRLIEYIFPTGTDIAEILRRSLVGRIEMGMVAITATIIDSTDMRQEDLLGLARKQPGVWLANPEAMNAHTPYRSGTNDSGPGGAEETIRHLSIPHFPMREYSVRVIDEKETKMDMPDTGPAFTKEEESLAGTLLQLFGYRGVHTLALALSNVAEELQGNTEPEKFLTPKECLGLANALMQEIPPEWQGEGIEAPAPAPVDDAERTRRAEIQARLGAKPEPVYKEPPNAD